MSCKAKNDLDDSNLCNICDVIDEIEDCDYDCDCLGDCCDCISCGYSEYKNDNSLREVAALVGGLLVILLFISFICIFNKKDDIKTTPTPSSTSTIQLKQIILEK